MSSGLRSKSMPAGIPSAPKSLNNAPNGGTTNGNSGASSNRRTTAAAATTATARQPPSRGGRNNGSSQQQQFYPKLITTQIIALQCFHYFLLSVFYQVNHVLYGTSITIDRIFTDRFVSAAFKAGWSDAMAIILASIVGAFLLAIIVEKSKKCLDFSCTLFLLHLLICSMYGGFPTKADWWIVHITGTIIMVVLGEYLCSRRELDDIPLLQL